MKNRKTLVICDDDRTDIKLFKKHLGAEKLAKYDLIEISSAEELISIVNDKRQHPDLIFLDYYLGEETGIEVLREIIKVKNIPVVMLTGRGDEEIAVECMKNGAADYIPKDTLDKIDIEKTIRLAIERWEVEQERDQLLGIAAHELRNPIAVLLGYTEMLLEYEEIDEQQRREIFQTLNDRSHHLLNIINELLNITRIEKGIITLKKKKADLAEAAAKKVKDYELLAAKKKITIKFEGCEASAEAEFDPDRIEEVISNLLDNAIKYSPKNTTVEVSASVADGYAMLSIKDQGLGIKEEELKYLFKLFSSKKISTLPTGEEARTGLGLAICQKVVEAHGGEILVESQYGKGSVFTIVIPLQGPA